MSVSSLEKTFCGRRKVFPFKLDPHRCANAHNMVTHFLTFETDFVLFLAVLEILSDQWAATVHKRN